MRSQHDYLIKILCTGIIILILLSIPIFYLGQIYYTPLSKHLWPREMENPFISPSGLANQWDDANSIIPSRAYVHLGRINRNRMTDLFLHGSSFFSTKSHSRNRDPQQRAYFDKDLGVMVFADLVYKGKKWRKTITAYAGPDGFSETYDPSLGRFDRNIVKFQHNVLRSMIILDKSQKRFYRIGVENKRVHSGKELDETISENILTIGYTAKTSLRNHFSVYWIPPNKISVDSKNRSSSTIIEGFTTYRTNKYCIVANKDGRLSLFDLQKLELVRTMGYLPAPTFDEISPYANPNDLLGYSVSPCFHEDEYLGSVAGSLSRDLLKMNLVVFDPNGKVIRVKESNISLHEMPGGMLLMTGKYILKNLQPAILGFVSYVTADSIEATAGYRGMLLMPNSFVAMFARDSGESMLGRWIVLLLMISPSLLLGGFLGWRVVRNAKVVGLDKQTRRWWLVGTILFGLTAYITYRITRPKMALVTCENCGKLRRPDFDRCHHCQSGWELPELQPPQWSVRTANA